ncbi:MAG: hypothetical protein IJT30_11340 [Muribaculaceae bacterium]|nr:hypothetical protein [Muribaculaceae bacterium]
MSDTIGRSTYDWFNSVGFIAVPVGLVLLAVTVVLTWYFHNGFVQWLLGWLSGKSLVFTLLMAAMVALLDVEVEVDDTEPFSLGDKHNKTPIPLRYKLTIAWGITLVALAIAAIFFSERYYQNYRFDCETFFVDTKANVYHLTCHNDCEDKAKAHKNGTFDRLQGYELTDQYTLCEYCEEWAEAAESEAVANSYQP